MSADGIMDILVDWLLCVLGENSVRGCSTRRGLGCSTRGDGLWPRSVCGSLSGPFYRGELDVQG